MKTPIVIKRREFLKGFLGLATLLFISPLTALGNNTSFPKQILQSPEPLLPLYRQYYSIKVLSTPEDKLPLGMIVEGIFPGPEWLPCDGRQLAIRDYPRLFKLIGQTYGPITKNSSTFRVPDLRERVIYTEKFET